MLAQARRNEAARAACAGAKDAESDYEMQLLEALLSPLLLDA